MLPAGQRADAGKRQLRHTLQAVARRIAKDGALHVRRLHLAPVHLDLAILPDQDLRDEERVVVVLGEAERDGDVVFTGAVSDAGHLWGVKREGVLDVLDIDWEINGTTPVCHILLY